MGASDLDGPDVLGLSVEQVLDAELSTQVAALETLVDRMTAAGGDEQPDADVLATASVRTHKAVERLEAQRLAWLCAVEADGRWALDALRTFAQWVAWSHGTSVAGARRAVRLARALRDELPGTSAAARAGLIGADHVRIMADVAASSQARRDALAARTPGPAPESDGPTRDNGPTSGDGQGPTSYRRGEDVLLDLARTHRPEPFRRVTRHFAAVADPDASDRSFHDAAEREFLDVSATIDGFHVAGFLTTEHGQAVTAALSAVVGVPAADDLRTPGRRRAQGLSDLARAVLDQGLVGVGAAVRPHLTVTVSWTEWEALLDRTGADADPVTGEAADWEQLLSQPPARWVDGTGPVPTQVLKRLACDGEVTRVVFGPDSQILNVGRRERTVTGARRQAVIARDEHCVWPGCAAPPGLCEVHHALTTWAAGGGQTSTDNAALLCWFHHAHVDTHGITMSRADGRWAFQRRDGTQVTADPANGTALLGAR